MIKGSEKIKNIFSREGAASILVIFTLILLIMFGMLTLTTALAGKRLSMKAVNWAREYYLLDSAAEAKLMDIDAILASCEEDALKYIQNREYEKEASAILSAEQHNNLQKLFAGSETTSVIALEEAFIRVYLIDAYNKLNEYSQNGEADVVLINGSDETDPAGLADTGKSLAPNILGYRFNAAEGDEQQDKNLDVALEIINPTIEIEGTGGAINRAEGYVKRYRIISWKEWQQPFDYNPQWWDGTIDNGDDEQTAPDVEGEEAPVLEED